MTRYCEGCRYDVPGPILCNHPKAHEAEFWTTRNKCYTPKEDCK